MARPISLAASMLAIVGCVVACPAAAGAQPLFSAAPRIASGMPGSTATGRLEGIVTDERGTPVGGVAVTAQSTRVAYAVSDRDGRFVFDTLKPGPYLVRAQMPGFIASERSLIHVLPASAAWQRLKMQRAGAVDGPPPPARQVLAAGLWSAQVAAMPADADPGGAEPPVATPEPASHDDSPTAWRLRHARRSVLRETGPAVIDGGDIGAEGSGRPVSGDIGQARLAAELWSGLPLSGQVQFLTTSTFDSPEDLFSASAPRGVAYIAVSAPIGRNATWAVQGAVTQGDLSSWVIGGSYVGRLGDRHALDAGVSHATQRYVGGNPVALTAVNDGARMVGAMFAFDEWTMSKRATFTYGARYARYDYLEDPGLLSPSVGLRLALGRTSWLRAGASREMLAPGAEEFVPSAVAGMWLPPQRTFSPLSGSGGFRAERSRNLEVVFERQVASFLISAHGFRQDVDDQVVTLFGVRLPQAPMSDIGHYYTANVGDLSAFGWGVAISRPVASRIRGSVSYTVSHGVWRSEPRDAAVLAVWAPSVVRPGGERLHDLTTVFETDIPETATRVYAAYRLNTGFASPSAGDDQPVLAARFDLQVAQRLPFLEFTNTQWEVLLSIRNLFRELESGAFYDELLVVRPPKRIVGGLMVRF
jgi:hypothetical protein